MVAGDGRVSIIGCDDFADQRVSYHVFRLEMGERYIVDAFKYAFDGGKAGFRYCQINLRHVTRDDHFRVETQSCQEHLHLLFGGILRFVEDHERIVERASTHVRKRRDFNGTVIHVAFELVRSKHVGKRVVQRTKIRIDFFVQCARQETEVLSGFHRRSGQDDAPHLPILKGANRLGYCKIRLTCTGRTNGERDGVRLNGIDIGDLTSGFRANRLTKRKGDHSWHVRLAAVCGMLTL